MVAASELCTESRQAWNLPVLDNGVTSKELWRTVYVEDDLSWGLFSYAGAASVVGQAYRGKCSITVHLSCCWMTHMLLSCHMLSPCHYWNLLLWKDRDLP